MTKSKFKILSIDGGGIKGVFPAYLLMLIESELEKRNDGKTKIYQHFDLITGTSTGGIIALALSYGIPAKDIYELYLNNANKIFGNKKSFLKQIFYASHENNFLEKLIRKKFRDYNKEIDPRLKDCKTDICIPIYDLIKGNPSVLKTKYHKDFERDYHIPAYQVALATSAAPTYFKPYSATYKDLNNIKKTFSNKIDGGVMANNPTLIALLEAVKVFKKDISDLEILSIGTGYKKFTDLNSRKKWGLHYWMLKDNRKRLIELFMQSQSQLVENYISILHKGTNKNEKDNFVYDRIDIELTEGGFLEMDESDKKLISNYAELAAIEFQYNRTTILKNHFY